MRKVDDPELEEVMVAIGQQVSRMWERKTSHLRDWLSD